MLAKPTAANKVSMVASEITVKFNKQRETWEVYTPPKLNAGKRDRRNFATKSEAEAYRRAQEVRTRDDGAGGANLTRDQRDIAAKVFRLFPEGEEHLALEAAREYLAKRDQRSRSRRFADAYQEWEVWTVAKTRNGQPTSNKYKEQMRLHFERLSLLHEKLFCDITSEDVEAALHNAVKPEHRASRNQILRTLTACVNYGIEREWLAKSPIKTRLMARDSGHKEPEILTVDQCTRLLSACLEVDRELLGYYVLALFAGIRPTDELAGLRWEHVFGDGGRTVLIPAEVAKTRFQRTVTIEPTLKAWLGWMKVPYFGPVTPEANLRKRRRKVQHAAGITPWPQDGMRHSYASYWMAVHRDEDKCRDNMGHRTKDQLVKHYRKHMTEEQARAFWALTPDSVAKITPINTATA